MLKNIIGVEEAGEILGLSPGTVKNYCNEGKLVAQKIGKTWLLDKNNLKLTYKKTINSLNDVYYNGLTLSSTSGIHNIEEGFYLAFFSNVRLSPQESTSHFKVTWDLKPLFDLNKKGEYAWGMPHAMEGISKKEEEDLLEYISTLEPYGKKIDVRGKEFTIINLPTPLWDTVFRAYAKDFEGNLYKFLWNVCNIESPFKIEKTNDPSLYCSKCLRHWSIDRRCVDEAGHDYAHNEV
ncbi:helix-turn-helix domain-containing protein [Shouchella clausii]|uniref:helix-turn-helix domain-containing protein n=1 Tax=Shouchella clausii TaxID=79880 RepID=UPI002DBF01A7|nr:helix-turn-helix domain-containing protein [Shouchella clausii]MEB5480902.1 helix-turn-helix domain-containing protein [Shouchella clausii]